MLSNNVLTVEGSGISTSTNDGKTNPKKARDEIVAALRRIPYRKVARYINQRYLNNALRKIPKIVVGSLGRDADGHYCIARIKVRRLGWDVSLSTGTLRYRFCNPTIILDPYELADHIQNGIPVTSTLTHELIHAIQYQNGYAGGHTKVFEECCRYASRSGLQVEGGGETIYWKSWSPGESPPKLLQRSPHRTRKVLPRRVWLELIELEMEVLGTPA